MNIIYSSKFAREYKRLSPKSKLSAERQEKIFRNNPFDLKLNTHKLIGRVRDFF